MFRLELTQCQLILYQLRAEQSCTYTARRWRRPAERAYYRSTCIPSSRRSGRINATPARHDHRADAIHSLYITVSVPIHVS